jgi:hypothetical protein
LERGPIEGLLWRKLIDVLNHPGAPAGVGAGNPILTPKPGRKPPGPVDVEWDEALPWDQELERLSGAENRADVDVLDKPTPQTGAYWAVLFLSTAAYQARLRASTKSKSSPRKKGHPSLDALP